MYFPYELCIFLEFHLSYGYYYFSLIKFYENVMFQLQYIILWVEIRALVKEANIKEFLLLCFIIVVLLSLFEYQILDISCICSSEIAWRLSFNLCFLNDISKQNMRKLLYVNRKRWHEQRKKNSSFVSLLIF